jgi:hypothetical protein
MVLELDHLASEDERNKFIRIWRGKRKRESKTLAL